MTRWFKLQLVGALLASATWCLPVRQLAAAPPVNGEESVQDVALDSEGRLTGQALDTEGRLLVGEPINVMQGNESVATSITDSEGRFAVAGLRGGLYQISLGDHVRVCRVWAPNTAPPAASPRLLMTTSADVERGQRPAVDLLHPVLIGLIIAAAIAIPIALHDDDDAS